MDGISSSRSSLFSFSCASLSSSQTSISGQQVAINPIPADLVTLLPDELRSEIVSNLGPQESLRLARTCTSHREFIHNYYSERLLPELQHAQKPEELYLDPKNRKHRYLADDAAGMACLRTYGIISPHFISQIKRAERTLWDVLEDILTNTKQFNQLMRQATLSQAQSVALDSWAIRKYAGNGLLSAERILATDVTALSLLEMQDIQEIIDRHLISVEKFLNLSPTHQQRLNSFPFSANIINGTHTVDEVIAMTNEKMVAYLYSRVD